MLRISQFLFCLDHTDLLYHSNFTMTTQVLLVSFLLLLFLNLFINISINYVGCESMFAWQIKNKVSKVYDLPKVTQYRWWFDPEFCRMTGPWKVALEGIGADTNIQSRTGIGDQWQNVQYECGDNSINSNKKGNQKPVGKISQGSFGRKGNSGSW